MYVMRNFQSTAFSNFPINVCINKRHFLCVKFKTSVTNCKLKSKNTKTNVNNISLQAFKCTKHVEPKQKCY